MNYNNVCVEKGLSLIFDDMYKENIFHRETSSRYFFIYAESKMDSHM